MVVVLLLFIAYVVARLHFIDHVTFCCCCTTTTGIDGANAVVVAGFCSTAPRRRQACFVANNIAVSCCFWWPSSRGSEPLASGHSERRHPAPGCLGRWGRELRRLYLKSLQAISQAQRRHQQTAVRHYPPPVA